MTSPFILIFDDRQGRPLRRGWIVRLFQHGRVHLRHVQELFIELYARQVSEAMGCHSNGQGIDQPLNVFAILTGQAGLDDAHPRELRANVKFVGRVVHRFSVLEDRAADGLAVVAHNDDRR